MSESSQDSLLIDPDLLGKVAGQNVEVKSVMKLKGDASDRNYYRVTFSTDGASAGESSFVVMKLAHPFLDGELPFLNILNHLKDCHLPVPNLYGYDQEKGLLFLEDLGDMTLQDTLREADEKAIRDFYRQAIDDLLIMQTIGSEQNRERCVAFTLAFDVEKLMWELDFFLMHTVQGLFRTIIAEADLRFIRQEFLRICQLLSNQERVFTHRDYHSRNLMVKNGRLRIIDFQDARLGPCQYDLASLLRDPYVVLPDQLVEELIDYYVDQREYLLRETMDLREFRRIFDYMAIQRNLKALGTFGFMKGWRENNSYLEYIPPTVRYVRENLSKYPDLARLRNILSKYIDV
ncbi:MAG: phosphotransferase [Candidatus Tectomicrobia bacterium]|nr:phosphotransferase [Candidatus Tectomicrobia bacterium]